LQGQPVADGLIEFLPLDDQGTKAGGQIVNGEDLVPRDKGLSPGRYKVTIYAGDGASGAGTAGPSSPKPGFVRGQERVAPAYNTSSTVIRQVKDGPNRFDFDIP